MNLAYFRITNHLHDSVLAEDSVQGWGRGFQPQFTGTYNLSRGSNEICIIKIVDTMSARMSHQDESESMLGVRPKAPGWGLNPRGLERSQACGYLIRLHKVATMFRSFMPVQPFP